MPGRSSLREARRIVVKVGTNVVTHDGVRLALGRLFALVEDLAAARRDGREVVLVSSGAVGMGMRALGMSERPASLGVTQACAAVGQAHLMALYNQAFGQLGVIAAQVLLTQEDLTEHDRALCLRTTLMRLLEMQVVPVLNENDSVSVRELIRSTKNGFGDNDGLSARVGMILSADLLILLTDVAGVYDKNPKIDPSARRISELVGVPEDSADVGGTSSGGTGGMGSKLEAARMASEAGTTVVIAQGSEAGILNRILAGEDVGTLVLPAQRRKDRQRRIAWLEEKRGALVANEGALDAMRNRKASLLPIGVTGVEGEFARGDVVEIRDAQGRVHGRGLANYDSEECRSLVGRHSSDIERIIGWKGYSALITRTNIIMATI